MKNLFALLPLFFIFLCLIPKAQTPSDTSRSSEKQFTNYYFFFNETTDSSIKRSVSRFGHYVSAGIGKGSQYGIPGAAILLSYSMAFKSHILSFTYGTSYGPFSLIGFGGAIPEHYNADYTALLIGESLRFRYAFISLAAGIGRTIFSVEDYKNHKYYSSSCYPKSEGINSFPVELKAFFLGDNIIGLGIHLSWDFVPAPDPSPNYFGFCLVFGYWNKPNSWLFKN